MTRTTFASQKKKTLSVLCISESCIEIKIKLLFSHFFVVTQKVFKVFIKPFDAPQRSAKIKT